MRRSSTALLLALSSSLFTAACSDTGVVASGATAPSERSSVSSAAAVSTACDYDVMRTTALSYFTSGGDPVFTFINDMQSASAHGLQAATDASWQITRAVASGRLTSRVTSAAAGKAFVSAVFNCTTLVGNSASPDTLQQKEAAEYADFISNAELILQQGLFAVRDGNSTVSAAALLSVNGTRTFAAPKWGVEAIGGAWPTAATGVAYLVYGYPSLFSITDVTPATAINTNNGVSPSAYNAFTLGSLPTAQPKLPLRVGVCRPAAGSSTANRLLHFTSIQVNESPTQLCGAVNPTSLDVPADYSSLHGIGAYLAALVSPRLLYAQDVLSIGGHVSDWSPFTTATLTSGNLSITFATQPTNSNVRTSETIDVLVALKGLPVPGVAVKLNLFNNKGVPAGAGFTPKDEVVTNSDGIARFSVTFTKAGGYTIVATGVLSPVNITSPSSNLFNIKN